MFVPLQESVPVVDPSAASGVLSLLWVIIALPALGAPVILLLGNSRTLDAGRTCSAAATLIGSFVLSVVAFVDAARPAPRTTGRSASTLYTWVQAGSASRSTSGCSTTRCRRCSCC